MTPADWVIVLVILLIVVVATVNGFFMEAIQMAGLVVGYLVAAWQYPVVAGWLMPFLKTRWLAELAGYFLTFAAVMIAAGITGRVARWASRKAGLTMVDRVLGAGLGLVKGSLIVALMLMALTAFQPAAGWIAGSSLAPYFLVVGRAAIWVAPSELRARFYQGLATVERSRSNWDTSHR
jgi:membrane protein required for colicin V production